jgi:hypothetical protein
MAALPNDLALTVINDGAEIIASDHRNNYADIQAAVNALRDALANGTAGQLLRAIDATDIGYTTAEYPSTAGAAGNVLRSDGTNLLSALLALTDLGPGTQHTLALSGASHMGSLATGNALQQLFSGGASADPAWRDPGYSGTFDLVSSSSLTTIFTQSIAADYIGATGALEIAIVGDYLQNAASDLTLLISFGGTTLWEAQLSHTAVGNNGSHRALVFRAVLANEGSAAVQRLAGAVSVSSAGAGGGGAVGLGSGIFSDALSGTLGGSSSVDTHGSAQTLLIQAQHSVNSASVELKGSVHVLWRP